MEISGEISPINAIRFINSYSFYDKELMYRANWDFFRAANLLLIILLFVNESMNDIAVLNAPDASDFVLVSNTLRTNVLYCAFKE